MNDNLWIKDRATKWTGKSIATFDVSKTALERKVGLHWKNPQQMLKTNLGLSKLSFWIREGGRINILFKRNRGPAIWPDNNEHVQIDVRDKTGHDHYLEKLFFCTFYVKFENFILTYLLYTAIDFDRK